MPVSVLSKWGNSLALRVPAEAAANYREGDKFEVEADAAGLHFKKTRKIKKYGIGEVLELFSSERKEEMDWSEPQGREIW